MGFWDKLFRKTKIKSQENMIQQELISDDNTLMDSSCKLTAPSRGIVNIYKVEDNDITFWNLKKRYIAFDVETTGLSPKEDRIIEVGAVLFEYGEIVDTYSTLVNPNVKIPSEATAVNHITNDMVKKAPSEDNVYLDLIEFLGDALNSQTIICAHNAKFDMNFLSETLMRLGYNGSISYIDTLSLARKAEKGLHNYKQDTIANYFGIYNQQAHRAVFDAETCGKILWKLLQKKDENQLQEKLVSDKIELSPEEMEVCAFIQDSIIKKGGDTEWLGFIKNSNNYVSVNYLYNILKFKFARKGKYLIVKKDVLKGTNFIYEHCTVSEGGGDYVRLYFNTPFELEELIDYFFDIYQSCRKSAMDYVGYNAYHKDRAEESKSMMIMLSTEDVRRLLIDAETRRLEKLDIKGTPKSDVLIKREDIIINPIHNRVPLGEIRNLNNWSKGFEEGYQFWEKGDTLRKAGDLESAIRLFDEARYKGYCAPVLFESYAMAYRKLKDYHNEIDILDEGIEREKNQIVNLGRLVARRDKAIQLLYKQQEQEKKIYEKKNKSCRTVEGNKGADVVARKSIGRPILQLSDKMIIIEKYETIAEAVRRTGISSKSIRDAAKGIQKHAGGFIWKYADEDEK